MLSEKNNVWYCTKCYIYNSLNNKCRKCNNSVIQTIDLDCWVCKDCSRYQYISEKYCLDCHEPRSKVDIRLFEVRMNKLREQIEVGTFKNIVPKNKKVKKPIKSWICDVCTYINENDFNRCMMCDGNKNNTKNENKNECKICMAKEIDSVIIHKNVNTAHSACFECATIIKKKHGRCPFCKQRIKMVVKVYNS